MKNDASEPYWGLIIPASERFQKMACIRFDAELNGLQTDIKFILAIDFSNIQLIKILKN